MRVLLIAEAANPQWTSVPLEGWSHSRALSQIVDAHVVTQIRNRRAMIDAGWREGRQFTAIDSEAIAKPFNWMGEKFRGGAGKGWTTVMAFSSLSYYYFEHLVWNRFRDEIKSHHFDLVHRITPLSPTAPSLMAAKCRRAGVPFVMGPLNGGVPWPKGFDRTRRREKEYLSYFRVCYKFMPGFHSTRRSAAAIIIGSRDAFQQMPSSYHDKCVYIPENAIDPDRFTVSRQRVAELPIRAAFVGRLVPYKGADMLLDAAAGLICDGRLQLDIIGDGPEMPKLRRMVDELNLAGGVKLDGWVEHTQLAERLAESDVFAFPSIREFGGAVVLEAMAVGLMPIIVDYAGPGELVTDRTGLRVPIGSRERIIAGFREALQVCVDSPEMIQTRGAEARRRVMALFTWPAKARQVMEVYQWVLGDRPDKPDFGMPLGDLESHVPTES